MEGEDRGADEVRAIHGQRVAVVLKLFVRPAPRRASVPGLNGDGMNRLLGDGGNMLVAGCRH